MRSLGASVLSKKVVTLSRASITCSVAPNPEDLEAQAFQGSDISSIDSAAGSHPDHHAVMPSEKIFKGEALSVQLGGDLDMQQGDSIFAGASYDPNSSGWLPSAPVPYQRRPPYPFDYPAKHAYDDFGETNHGQNHRGKPLAGYVVPIDPGRLDAWIDACPRSGSQLSMSSTHNHHSICQSLPFTNPGSGFHPEGQLQPSGYIAGGRRLAQATYDGRREHLAEDSGENHR